MDRESTVDVDASDPDHREIGRGLLTEETGPGTALAHLYRGEVHRMNLWRERLDQTTYWAIVVLSAILTWTFSSRNNPHYVLLFGGAALAAFLLIEARRFRGYNIWRGRVRTLQRNVFAYGLDPSTGLADADWREKLSRDYRDPGVDVGIQEAVAHRLRRVYLWLVFVLVGAWVVRIGAFASRAWPRSAAVGRIPGTVVTAVVAALVLLAVAVAVRPRTWHEDELRSETPGE